MANIRRKRIKQEYALLKAGRFFRDELSIGTLSARQSRAIEELHKLVFDALDDPSVRDAQQIEDRYSRLTINQAEPLE